MKNIQREIDEVRMNQSKSRTIENVMNKIEELETKSNTINPFNKIFKTLSLSVVMIFVIVFALVLINTSKPTIPVNNFTEEIGGEELAEVAYISGHILNNSLSLNTMSNSHYYLPIDQLSLNSDIEEYEVYFDILINLHKNSSLQNEIVVTGLTDNEYETKITFDIDGISYIMYVNLDDEEIAGVLEIDDMIFNLEGTFKVTEEDVLLEIEASNNDNSIEIKYESKNEEESEENYKIKQNILGVESEKEIHIEYSPELTIEMSDNDDSFDLSQIEHNQHTVYVLQYEVNGESNELFVIEENNDGIIIYRYVTEGEYDEFDIEDDEDILDTEDEDDDETEEDDTEN